MNFLQVSIEEAITRVNTGAQIYMLMPVHPGTTTEELNASNGYVVPEEKKKPGPKPKSKSGAKSKVDEGKLHALYDGGWLIKDIAEEMKISESTVIEYLNKGKATA